MDVSDVEDGFAWKKRNKKVSASARKRVRGECIIPPRPVKHILSSYTLSNLANQRDISDYVEWQARGERVLHAEKLKTERLFSAVLPMPHKSPASLRSGVDGNRPLSHSTQRKKRKTFKPSG